MAAKWSTWAEEVKEAFFFSCWLPSLFGSEKWLFCGFNEKAKREDDFQSGAIVATNILKQSIRAKSGVAGGDDCSESRDKAAVRCELLHLQETIKRAISITPVAHPFKSSEINRMDVGLIVEVWHKGMLWDKFIGCVWIPLNTIQYSNELLRKKLKTTKIRASQTHTSNLEKLPEKLNILDDSRDIDGAGLWLSLDAEFVMKEGVVAGTSGPTGHSVLIDSRFELPYDMQDAETTELQKKLEVLNTIMDQEVPEDSDYTSDLNYPLGHVTNAQHPNSSASQFRNATANSLLGATSGSLEDPNSRQSSYELEDSIERQASYENEEEMKRSDSESEPLYYNSRPHYQYRSDSWEDRDSPIADSRRTSISQQSTGTQEYYSEGERTSEQENNYSDNRQNSQWNSSSIRSGGRRPSLERQKGVDQDHPPYYDEESPGDQYDRYDDNYDDNYDGQYDDQYEDATDYGSVDRTEGPRAHPDDWYEGEGESYDSYDNDRRLDDVPTYVQNYADDDDHYNEKYRYDEQHDEYYDDTSKVYQYQENRGKYSNTQKPYHSSYRDDKYDYRGYRYQDYHDKPRYDEYDERERERDDGYRYDTDAGTGTGTGKYSERYRQIYPDNYNKNKMPARYNAYDNRREFSTSTEEYLDAAPYADVKGVYEDVPVRKKLPKVGVPRRQPAKVDEIKPRVDVVVESWDRESLFYSAEEEQQWERPRIEVEPVKETRRPSRGELEIPETANIRRRSQGELAVEEVSTARRRSHAELDVEDVPVRRLSRCDLDVKDVLVVRRPSRSELDVQEVVIRRSSRGDLAEIAAALPEVITTDEEMPKNAIATFREVFVESKNEDFKDSFETSDYKDSFDTEYKDSFDTEYKDSFDTEYKDSFETEEMVSKDTEADIIADTAVDISQDIGIGVVEDADVKVPVKVDAGPRPTPRQRWINAYNKICSQLNTWRVVKD
uniref:Uncharacterized protein n=1 Tax=Strigamia maritima TaxID=126957 RepID=T1JP84_STRMM